MNPLHEQLIEAYRQEEQLYRRVLDVVTRQKLVMEAEPDPRAVLDLCEKVEGLMGEIGAIEQTVEPVKEQWQQERRDPDGELSSLLASIEGIIAQVGQTQQEVQQSLARYMERRRQETEQTRASINASRAGNLYRAG